MTPEKLLKLQGLLVDDICRLAFHLSKMGVNSIEARELDGCFLHRSMANRRIQLEIVNDLMQGRKPRSQMPVDWGGSRNGK